MGDDGAAFDDLQDIFSRAARAAPREFSHTEESRAPAAANR